MTRHEACKQDRDIGYIWASNYQHIIKDLNVKDLARIKLAKSSNNAGIGIFYKFLEYKALWASKRVIKIDR